MAVQERTQNHPGRAIIRKPGEKSGLTTLHPILLLAVLIAVLAFVSWYKRAPKAQRKHIGNRVMIAGGLGLVLLLLLTGRLNPVVALVAALIPLAHRALGLFQLFQGAKGAHNAFKASRGPSPGQKSDVETRFLRMTLNHDTGQMEGQVLDGAYKGKRLSDLQPAELLGLLDECVKIDAQSAAVLETYLDRTQGDAWRKDGHADERGDSARARSGGMNAEEAREILGVEVGASRQQIIEAHRRLIQKLHPDRGGSTYLAAKLNEAKRMLLE